MTLEEHIKRYDDRAKSIRNAIVEKSESQEVVELLSELKKWRDFGNSIGRVLGKHFTEEELFKMMEVNADEE